MKENHADKQNKILRHARKPYCQDKWPVKKSSLQEEHRILCYLFRAYYKRPNVCKHVSRRCAGTHEHQTTTDICRLWAAKKLPEKIGSPSSHFKVAQEYWKIKHWSEQFLHRLLSTVMKWMLKQTQFLHWRTSIYEKYNNFTKWNDIQGSTRPMMKRMWTLYHPRLESKDWWCHVQYSW